MKSSIDKSGLLEPNLNEEQKRRLIRWLFERLDTHSGQVEVKRSVRKEIDQAINKIVDELPLDDVRAEWSWPFDGIDWKWSKRRKPVYCGIKLLVFCGYLG